MRLSIGVTLLANKVRMGGPEHRARRGGGIHTAKQHEETRARIEAPVDLIHLSGAELAKVGGRARLSHGEEGARLRRVHHRTYARQFHPRARRRLELGYRIERTLASVHTPCEGSGWTAVHVALRRARSLERLVLVLGCLLGCLEERRLDHRGALAEW